MVGPPPLQGIKVLEFAGLAPGPYAGMMLADAGATVLRVNRPAETAVDVLARRKSSLAVDLKSPRGVRLLRALVAAAPVDVVIDPFRPGVLERLGLGPEDLRAAAPGLIYARLTGYRRDGRYAHMAGHDINYIAVSGALSLLGAPGQPPQPPTNMLGDFAGGGAALAQGILLALIARQRRSSPPPPGAGAGAGAGAGQVVEANMVDGSAYVATFSRMARLAAPPPLGGRPRGAAQLDGLACPWYRTYATADGRFVAVGAIEPRFFGLLLDGLGLRGRGWADDEDGLRHEEARWPELRALFAARFASRDRAHWERVFDGTDACVAPVLGWEELRAESAGGGGPGREGRQRPQVTLRETPCRAITQRGEGEGDEVRGQGEGVEGEGYLPALLGVGEGGDEVLAEWVGWRRGVDYDEVEEGGGVVLVKDRVKL